MDLPVLGQPARPERADAARNRLRVLRAAERLFAERGATEVSMEDIAAAAGVGKGTLYRRYPDRAAVALALLDEHDRRLQEQLLRGAPPLGPGAEPAQRLIAFYAAMVDMLDRHLDLVLVADAGEARYRTGSYAAWRTHVLVLVRQAGIDDPHGVLAELLLAPLSGELYRRLREQGRPASEVLASLADLASRVLK